MNIEFLEQLDQRQIRLLTIALIAIVLVAMTTYVIMPKTKQYQGAVKSRDTLLASTPDAKQFEAQLQSLDHEVAQLKRDLHGDMDDMPAKQVESYVIGRLQDLSWENQVELVSVEPQPGNPIENFNETLFKVELRGDYFDMYAWIGDISRELGFVVIKQYDMQPADAADIDPLLKVQLTIATYRAQQT